MDWPAFPSELVLEGGAIEIILRAQLKPDQVAQRTRRERTEDMLGLEKIVSLENGLVPDPITDGRGDGIVKWISKDAVMLHAVDDRSLDPENYDVCQRAKDRRWSSRPSLRTRST